MAFRRHTALATSFVVTCGLALAAAPGASAATGGPAAVVGVVTTVVADDFSKHTSRTDTVLTLDDGRVLPLDAGPDAARPGTHVRALVAAGAARVVETLGADTVARATAAVAEHMYVVTVDDASTDRDFTEASATTIAQTAAGYWKTQSGGLISSFDVHAATITVDNSCAVSRSDLDAQARNQFPGVDLGAAGAHLVVFSPESCSYGYAGLAVVGSGFASSGWVHVVGHQWGILAHELGHNFGLGHANMQFSDPGTAGGIEGYWGLFGPQQLQFNDFDPGALDAAYRARLGVPGQRTSIAWNSLPATYRIAPLTSSTGVSALVIDDPVSGAPLYIDYRTGAGADGYTFYGSTFGPVTLGGRHVAYDAGVHVTSLQGRELNTLPIPVGGQDYRATATTGDALSLHGGRLRLTVGALSTTGADVTVSFSARPQVRTAAKITVPSVTERSRSTISVAVTGTSTPSGPVTIYQDGKLIATRTLVGGKVALSTPSALTRGAHSFAVRYAGGPAYSASSASTKVVVKDASAVHASVTKVKAGTSPKLSVRVASTLKATGVVKVYRGSTYVGKATLKGARATFHLPKTWKAKTYTLKVTYAGTATIAASKTSVKLVVKARR